MQLDDFMTKKGQFGLIVAQEAMKEYLSTWYFEWITITYKLLPE